MSDFYQTPRFHLPDDWSVPDTICVKVTIPNDPQYFGQLIGLIDTLKWSKNFAPDPTKLGAATVSRTWQAALESAPIEIEGCDMPEFRINTETCLLEVDCGEGDWQPVITPSVDPREDITYPTPYPGPPPSGQTNECLAAANLSDYVWYAAGHLAERIGTGAIITEIVVAMAGIIATFFQLLTTIIIDETLTLFVNITPATVDDDFLLLDKQDFTDLVSCYMDEAGKIPAARWGEFLDELLALGATNQAWYLVYYVCVLMGVGGFTLAAKISGIVEADCAVCPCIIAEWNFEENDGAFTTCDLFGSSPNVPIYYAADGWIMQGNVTSYRGSIIKTASYLQVTKIRVEVEYASGSDHYLAIRDICSGSAIADWSDIGSGLSVREYTFGAPTDLDGVHIYNGANGTLGATVKRIVLYCEE